jgi:hypothetical protein
LIAASLPSFCRGRGVAAALTGRGGAAAGATAVHALNANSTITSTLKSNLCFFM